MVTELTDQQALTYAGEVIRALSGGRWTWPARTVVEKYKAPGSWVGSPVSAHGSALPLTSRDAGGGKPRLHLSGRPVTDVARVVGPSGRDLSYELSNGFVLTLDRRQLASSMCGEYPEVTVTYTYGSEPPAMVARAIEVLANEIQLASQDQPCRLPERVTNVSRQGISWTVIDPQDFLDDGRTGIYEVDLVLNTVNLGRAKARARVFSPEFPPPRRIEVLSTEEQYALYITAGTPYTRGFRKLLSDGVTPAPLAGYTSRFQVKLGPAYAPVLDLALPIDELTATVQLTLDEAQTRLLTAHRYIYAIDLTPPVGPSDGQFVTGPVLVSPEIVW
jgi:hypothetical protein